MSTDTLQDVETTIDTGLKIDTENGEHDRFAHYVSKDDIIAATFEGKVVFALCGKLWVASKSPEGLPVCPTCVEVLETLPGGD